METHGDKERATKKRQSSTDGHFDSRIHDEYDRPGDNVQVPQGTKHDQVFLC